MMTLPIFWAWQIFILEVFSLGFCFNSQISNTVTLLANRDNARVKFSGSQSVFNILSLLGDDGVFMETDVTATGGSILLDGNTDDVWDDPSNRLQFTDGRKITAKTLLTLEATLVACSTCEANGGSESLIAAAGTLTLFAGSGIAIMDDLVVGTLNKPSKRTQRPHAPGARTPNGPATQRTRAAPAEARTPRLPWTGARASTAGASRWRPVTLRCVDCVKGRDCGAAADACADVSGERRRGRGDVLLCGA